MQASRRLRLKIALEDLREMKGFGTELVTVVIPPDRQISDARSLLQNEHGQAANIKSKGTRKMCNLPLSQPSQHSIIIEALAKMDWPYSSVQSSSVITKTGW